jgi:hypothetical protein
MTRRLPLATLFITAMAGFSQPPALAEEAGLPTPRRAAWNTVHKGLRDSDPEHLSSLSFSNPLGATKARS